MCNNIPQNKLNYEKGEEKKSYEIESRVFYNRQVTGNNVIAKDLKVINKDRTKMEYIKGHPLKLGDKSKVHEVYFEDLDEKYKKVHVVYSFSGESKRRETSFIRFEYDTLDDIEKFLIHAFSIYEFRNIDLEYMNK